MAQMVNDYEELKGEGIIGWALGRVQSISTTINEAERKLKGVIEAIQYKHKRMMNFVLEKNNLRSSDFFERDQDVIENLDEEA